MVVMEGTRHFELALRAKIAHVLGARSVFGHLESTSLEGFAPVPSPDHADWILRYKEDLSKAKNSDFVRHFITKYDSQLPIWAAVEVTPFGRLTRLFDLMDKKDRNEIAQAFGLQSGGDRLSKWLKSVNYLRNLCAHHGRLWNATLLYEVGKFPPALVDDTLTHISSVPPPADAAKLYRVLAVLAYMLRSSGAAEQWPASLATQVKKLPTVASQTPETNMGFPAGWRTLALWAPA